MLLIPSAKNGVKDPGVSCAHENFNSSMHTAGLILLLCNSFLWEIISFSYWSWFALRTGKFCPVKKVSLILMHPWQFLNSN